MFQYAPNQLISQVVIFGVGGTGGRLVPLVTQLLATQPFTKKAKVILMDGDIVEEKNCKRQLFIPSEVGKNKADVMALRYHRAFDSNTLSVPHFFPLLANIPSPYNENTTTFYSKEDNIGILRLMQALASNDQAAYEGEQTTTDYAFDSLLGLLARVSTNLNKGLTVFVLAVDSVEARKSIVNFIQLLAAQRIIPAPQSDYPNANFANNIVVIDGGNEDVFGQANYFSPVTYDLCPFTDVYTLPDRAFFQMPLAAVPFPVGRYEHMQEGASERRCGDIDQTLSVNNMVATMMHMIFHNLYYNIPMNFHRVNFNLNGALTTEYMTAQWMKSVLTTNDAYNHGILENKEGVKREALPFLDPASVEVSDIDLNLYGCVKTKCLLADSNRRDPSPATYKVLRTRAQYFNYRRPTDPPVYWNCLQEGEKDYFFLTKRTNFLSCSWTEIILPWMYEMVVRGQFSKEHYLNLAAKVLVMDSSVYTSPLEVRTYSDSSDSIDRLLNGYPKLVNNYGSPLIPNRVFIQGGYSCLNKVFYARPNYSRNDANTFSAGTVGLVGKPIGGNTTFLAAIAEGVVPIAGLSTTVSMSHSIALSQVRFSLSYVTMQAMLSDIAIESGNEVEGMCKYFTDKLQEVIREVRGKNHLAARSLGSILMFLSESSVFSRDYTGDLTGEFFHQLSFLDRGVVNGDPVSDLSSALSSVIVSTLSSGIVRGENLPYGSRSVIGCAHLDHSGRVNSDIRPGQYRFPMVHKVAKAVPDAFLSSYMRTSVADGTCPEALTPEYHSEEENVDIELEDEADWPEEDEEDWQEAEMATDGGPI